MDFRFDDDETAVIANVAKVVEHHFPLDRFRPSGSAAADWAALGADGWLDVALADDGPAMPFALQAACAREAGRHLAVESWIDNAFLLPRLVDAIADPAGRDAWAERRRRHPGFLLADGRAPTLVPGPATVDRAPWCFGVDPGDDAYLLAGPGAGGALELVCVRDPEVQLDALGELALDVGTATVAGGERVSAAVALDGPALDALVRQAAILHSAALVGLAERAEAVTVAYVKERKQFGVPIGQFQALQHILADVHVANEVAWNSVLYATLRGDEDPWAHPASRIQAAEAAVGASKAMLQLHGGIGFTWEADVHYFLKTAATGVARFGALDDHAAALGRAVVAAR